MATGFSLYTYVLLSGHCWLHMTACHLLSVQPSLMKKITFEHYLPNGHVPFWKPWGCMGCLGNLVIFVLLLLLLLFLLGLLRRCSDHRTPLPDEFNTPGDVYQPNDSTAQAPPTAQADPDWNQPLPGAEEVGLPTPDDNQLPPFNDDEVVPDPDNGGASQIYPNLLYVILDSQTDDNTFKAFAAKFKQLYPQAEYKIAYYNTSAKTAVLNVPAEKRAELCQKLPQQITEAQFLVVPVEVMTQGGTTSKPNDPAFRYDRLSWYFQPIQAFEAWGITQGSEEVTVGIVDSYMDLSHEELRSPRCIYPFSVPKGNADVAPRPGAPMDYAGHGTLVTSVAVGNANNGRGSCGIAPKCKFIPVSMGEHLNTITEVEGLLYCMYHGADVINLSCGTSFTNEAKRLPIQEQVKFAKQHGLQQQKMWEYVFNLADKRNVTIVWAAGNDNVFTAMDTSKRSQVTLRVSAVDRQLHKAQFSNFGNLRQLNVSESTISAPGVDIFGALPGNTYDMWPGTSFSAPIITGVVALMKSLNANLTTKEIIQILKETGRPVDGAPEIGPLVQIKNALLKVKGQMSNFESTPSRLMGTWEMTSVNKFYDAHGVPTGDKGKVRIKITSATTAIITYCLVDGNTYDAPATVSISPRRVDVRQTQIARRDGDDNTFMLHTYAMTPDAQNKARCTIYRDNQQCMQCYVRKINNA